MLVLGAVDQAVSANAIQNFSIKYKKATLITPSKLVPIISHSFLRIQSQPKYFLF